MESAFDRLTKRVEQLELSVYGPPVTEEIPDENPTPDTTLTSDFSNPLSVNLENMKGADEPAEVPF